MKVTFFGTPDFVVPVLNKLVKSDSISVVSVVTKPHSPIAARAAELSIPTLNLIKLEAQIPSENKDIADVFIVAAFGKFLGKFLTKELIRAPKYKTLNLHPSLLPKLRGTSPIKTAIWEGHKATGVTIIQMDEEMDHGPILAQAKVKLEGKETFTDLAPQLFTLGAELLVEILPSWKNYCESKKTKTIGQSLDKLRIMNYESWMHIPPISQNHQAATFTKMLTREDGKVDWKKPAEEIDRMVRALNPWPGAWTTIASLRSAQAQSAKYKTQNLGKRRVKILATHLDDHGKLVIDKLQVEGKKPISWGEFKTGYLNTPN